MAQEQQSLSEADKAFIQKLGRFRTTLSADEQQKLDVLVLAAHGVEQGGAVSGYQGGAGQVGPPWFYGNDPDNPQWVSVQHPRLTARPRACAAARYALQRRHDRDDSAAGARAVGNGAGC